MYKNQAHGQVFFNPHLLDILRGLEGIRTSHAYKTYVHGHIVTWSPLRKWTHVTMSVTRFVRSLMGCMNDILIIIITLLSSDK